jgi:hypothetical protein
MISKTIEKSMRGDSSSKAADNQEMESDGREFVEGIGYVGVDVAGTLDVVTGSLLQFN